MIDIQEKIQKIKTIKPKQAVYPSLVALFIVITGVLFTLTAKFLSDNINRIFLVDETGTAPAQIDIEAYSAAAKRLGISTVNPGPPVTTTPVPAPIATTTATSSASSSVKIASTTKKTTK